MNKRKRLGTSTESWETPGFEGNGRNKTQSIRMGMVRLLKKVNVHDTSVEKNPNADSFARKPSC